MMNAIKSQRPELYQKVTDWQTIYQVLTRVPDTVVVEIGGGPGSHGCHRPSLQGHVLGLDSTVEGLGCRVYP